MKNIKTFDIEAYNWNEIYAIGIYDGKEPKIKYTDKRAKNRVKSNNEFIDWLFENLENNDIVYAHNGGRYDFLFILDYVSEGKAKITKFSLIHGSIAQMVIRKDGKRIVFRDSYLILPASLLRLTNDFGVKHKKLKMDYELGVKDANFKEYFTNDLIGLYEVIMQSKLYDKLTIASNAMHNFLQFYKKEMFRNDDKIDEFFRLAYYGGRVEVFKHFGYGLNYYDVNSLYPYVMLNKYPLPIKGNYVKVNSFVKGEAGIYECDIEAPDMHIPVLPVKYNGKLIFPTGKFSGVWCSPELELAMEKGYKVEIKQGYIFPKTDYIFNDYVKYWYKIKKTSSGAKKAVAKLMLNSLYGKFGQRRQHKDLVPVFDKIPEVAVIYGNMAFEVKDSYDFYNQYLHSEIAAFVSSYARVHLFKLMESVGLENVYYCDTDSIITSGTCKVGDELGELKNEALIDKFIAIAPKMYAYVSNEGKVVIRAKGLRVDQLSYEAFEKALKGDLKDLKSEFDRITSFKEGLKDGNGIFTNIKKLVRAARSNDTKRIQLENGNTKPVKIEKA